MLTLIEEKEKEKKSLTLHTQYCFNVEKEEIK